MRVSAPELPTLFSGSKALRTSARPCKMADHSHSSPRAVANELHRTEKVAFHNASGTKIVGVLTETEAPAIVILCHGLASHKDGFHLPALATALAAEGVGSIRLDLTGSGESGGDFKYANQKEEAEDIRAAAQFVAGRGKQATGLLGHSKSGSSVLVYSAKYGDIPRVVVASGRFDHKRGLKERFGQDVFERVEREGGLKLIWDLPVVGRRQWVFTPEDLSERMTTDMAAVCGQVPPRVSVLVVHGSADATIPAADGASLAAALPAARLLEVAGADHNYSASAHRDALIAAAVGFLVGRDP